MPVEPALGARPPACQPRYPWEVQGGREINRAVPATLLLIKCRRELAEDRRPAYLAAITVKLFEAKLLAGRDGDSLQRRDPDGGRRDAGGRGCGSSPLCWLAAAELRRRAQRTPSLRLGADRHRRRPGHHLLARRSLLPGEKDTLELAFFRCWSPRPVTRPELIAVVGARWGIEDCFAESKGVAGLGHYQVRKYRAWYRHVTLSMLAHAFLSVAARPARPATASGNGRAVPAERGPDPGGGLAAEPRSHGTLLQYSAQGSADLEHVLLRMAVSVTSAVRSQWPRSSASGPVTAADDAEAAS